MAQVFEHYDATVHNIGIYDSRVLGQTFTPQISHTLTSVFVWLSYYGGGNSGTMTMRIYNTSGSLPTGEVLDSATIDASTVGTEASFEFVFSGGITLTADTEYAITLDNPNGTALHFIFWWGFNTGGYTRGTAIQDLTGAGFSIVAGRDMYFADWGTLLAPEKAVNPYPDDEEDGIPDGNSLLTLTWEDGGSGDQAATSYDVYLDTGSGLELIAEGITDTEFEIEDDLNELTEFSWRVDSINDNGTTEGDEWAFTTSAVRALGKARNPTPSDEATSQSPNLTSLQWDNGGGASSYTVYFGTPGNLVSIGTVDSNGSAFGTDESISLAFVNINGDTTYNWRVDATNGFGTLTGDVWEFSTGTLKSPTASDTNMMETERKLVAFANNKVWIES